MNIFVVHANPVIAAQSLCDKHIVKMPLETAQMLCTTAELCGSTAPYKACFVNHPCTVWARQSFGNWN